MRSLFIDTSSFFMCIAIIDSDKIVYKYEEEIKNDMASKIVPIIEEGFNNTGFSINDINRIYIVNGPGSYTGVRVGVTTAKTLAWALKKEIIPISSLEFIATTHTSKKYLVPMIDARRGNVFAGIYDKELNVIKKDQLISLVELTNCIDDSYELVSHDNIKDSIKPETDILKIIKKHEHDECINPHSLNPNYLKLTEAEESKLNND